MSGTELPPGFWQFVHLYEHYVMRKRGQEITLIVDCWQLVWFGPDSLPPWAEELADAGEPGTRWCPILRPELCAGSPV